MENSVTQTLQGAGKPDLADLEHLTVFLDKNPHVHPDLKGEDCYEARSLEFPGLVAFGKTAEIARERLLQSAAEDLQTASPDRRRRLQAIEAHVQFNHRITLEQKSRIALRAREAKVSVRQFMLNQCLYAPVWECESMPSDEPYERFLRNTALETAKRTSGQAKADAR